MVDRAVPPRTTVHFTSGSSRYWRRYRKGAAAVFRLNRTRCDFDKARTRCARPLGGRRPKTLNKDTTGRSVYEL